MTTDTPEHPTDADGLGDIEEVEAELVTTGDLHVDAGEPAEQAADEPRRAPEEPRRRATPVIRAPVIGAIIGVIAVAGAAGAYFFLKRAGPKEAPPAAQTGTAAQDAPVELTLPSAAPTDTGSPLDKIANEIGAPAKEAAATIVPPDATEGAITELPPPPTSPANAGFQDAAKDAFRSLAEDAAAAPEPPGESPGEPDESLAADMLENANPAEAETTDLAPLPTDAPAPENPVAADAPEGVNDPTSGEGSAPVQAETQAAVTTPAAEQVPDLGPDLLRLEAENSALRDEVASLRAALEEAAKVQMTQSNEIADLEAALGDARAALRAKPEPADGAAAAIALLAAIDAGAPYAAELAQLKRAVPALASNDAIAQAATEGVPSLAALRSTFPAHARRAIAASARAGAKGPVDRLWRSFLSLITVRPVEPVDGPGAAAALSRSESRLAAGDLAGALGELDGLDAPASEAMAPWRHDAELRLGVLDAARRAALARG